MNNGPRYIEPTQYELSGRDLRINYSVTSVAGVPTLSLQHRGRRQSFRGEQIGTLDTPMGRFVTVIVDTIPDLHTITLTLVVPGMNLDTCDGSLQTFAFFSTALTSIAGPRLVRGQLHRYENIPLNGRAQAVTY